MAQYHNPAFDLTPESALKEGHHTSAAAVAALKSLQKEKAAAKLMNPGHRTVSVVYSSQEGAPQVRNRALRNPPHCFFVSLCCVNIRMDPFIVPIGISCPAPWSVMLQFYLCSRQ